MHCCIYDIRRPSGEVSTNYIDTMCNFALYWWPHYHSRSGKVAYVVGNLSQTSCAHRWSVIFRNTAVPWEHKLTRISMIAMIVWWNLLSNTVLYIFAIKTTPDWPGWFLVLHIWHWLLKWSQYRPLWDSLQSTANVFPQWRFVGPMTDTPVQESPFKVHKAPQTTPPNLNLIPPHPHPTLTWSLPCQVTSRTRNLV